MDRFARGPFQVTYEARVDVGALRRKRVANAQRRREEAQLDARDFVLKPDWLACASLRSLLNGRLRPPNATT